MDIMDIMDINDISLLESLPDELIVEILDKLGVKTLIRIFSTSKRLRKFKSDYSDLINDYLYGNSQDKYNEYLQRLANKFRDEEFVWLNKKVSDFMGYSGVKDIYGRVILSRRLYVLWWNVYLLSNRLMVRGNVIHDPDIKELFDLNNTFRETFSYNLAEFHRLILSKVDKSQKLTKVQVTDLIPLDTLTFIFEEEEELIYYVSKLRKGI